MLRGVQFKTTDPPALRPKSLPEKAYKMQGQALHTLTCPSGALSGSLAARAAHYHHAPGIAFCPPAVWRAPRAGIPPQEDLQSPFCLPPASLRSGTWGRGALLLSARGLCLSPARPGPLTSRNELPSDPLRTVCPCLKEAPACAAGRLCRPVTRAPRPAASTVLGPRR